MFVILHENEYFHSAWLEILYLSQNKNTLNPSEISIDSEEDSMLGGFSYIWGVLKFLVHAIYRLQYRNVSREACHVPCLFNEAI